MKKFTTLLLAICLGSMAAIAQPLKIGIKGGMNLSSYSFDQLQFDNTYITPVKGNTTGYQLGLVMRLTIPKFIHIQPEINYIERGYRFHVNQGTRQTLELVTERIEVPVTVGFNIAALRIFGGPVFRIASNTRLDKQNKNFSVKFKESDVALQLGAGLDIRKFFLDVRYVTHPETTYENIYYKGSGQKVKVKNDEMWQFNIGFFF